MTPGDLCSRWRMEGKFKSCIFSDKLVGFVDSSTCDLLAIYNLFRFLEVKNSKKIQKIKDPMLAIKSHIPILPILHSSNPTPFKSYTLPTLHSSNQSYTFQYFTLPILHSSNLLSVKCYWFAFTAKNHKFCICKKFTFSPQTMNLNILRNIIKYITLVGLPWSVLSVTVQQTAPMSSSPEFTRVSPPPCPGYSL